MSNNASWGSSVVPHYSKSTYGKKKNTEEMTQPVTTAVESQPETKATGTIKITPKNPAASWDEPVNVLGATAEAQKTDKALPQWNTNANFAIRNSMENDFAIDGSRIGYKDGDVLLDGKFFMKADNNVDGTTYAKDYDAVAGSVNDYIKNNGLVAIRDYAASSGTAVNIQWNDAEKTVSINGRTVVPTAVVNGKAYIPQSQLDAILASERSTAGTSYSNIYNEVQDKYGAEENEAYNKYMQAKEFNYVPENDPSYQAYMAAAKKAIEDEYAANMAASRFRTGGVGSTGQMLQAAAIREDAVDDLSSARAQFEQNAYQRYLDEQALNLERYNVARGRMVDEYNTLADVNARDKEDFYYGQTFDRGMQSTEIGLENERLELGNTKRNYEISEKYAGILAALEVDNAILANVRDRETLKVALVDSGRYTMAEIENILDQVDAYNSYING